MNGVTDGRATQEFGKFDFEERIMKTFMLRAATNINNEKM
jgi:hypothetical protein